MKFHFNWTCFDETSACNGTGWQKIAMFLEGGVLTVNWPKLWYEDSGIFLPNLDAIRINIKKRVLWSFIMIERILMKLELAMQLAGKKSRSFWRGGPNSEWT